MNYLIVKRFLSRLLFSLWLCCSSSALYADSRPNILFCISDDQSYDHTGANGDPVIETPAFDRIAREGLRFVHTSRGQSKNLDLKNRHHLI